NRRYSLIRVTHIKVHTRQLLFFFSSRRRHTRFSRDWSSDVCSSDLSPPRSRGDTGAGAAERPARQRRASPASARAEWASRCRWQIGRASCRERAYIAEDDATLINIARKRLYSYNTTRTQY